MFNQNDGAFTAPNQTHDASAISLDGSSLTLKGTITDVSNELQQVIITPSVHFAAAGTLNNIVLAAGSLPFLVTEVIPAIEHRLRAILSVFEISRTLINPGVQSQSVQEPFGGAWHTSTTSSPKLGSASRHSPPRSW